MGPAAFQKTGDFVAARTRGGVEVFVLPTRKFKTKLVRIHMRARSSEQNAARALVPNLLRRGTRKCPSMALVSRAFESLYGSSWSSSVYKLGHDQITSIRLETVEERFLPGKPAIFKPALELTRELLFEPNLVGGQFPRDVFEQERLNHRRDIEAQYNEKMSWAFQRLLDEMFGQEPYGRPVLGSVEETDALTSPDTVAAWTELCERLPARAFAVGDFDPAEVVAQIDALLPRTRAAEPPDPAPWSKPAATTPRIVIERDEVSQSKLISGRQVDLNNLSEREFDALRVYAGVLGGGFHSRLFQTVREKHSLAYFASASLDRLRGVLYTSCGIDAADREQVRELVEREIDSLRAEPPRHDELEQTRRLMVSSARGMFDSAGGMIETLEAGLAAGRVRTLDGICNAVSAVTAQDVMAAARRVGPPEVVYCLEGESQHDDAAHDEEGVGSR
jgi:predicted Zn-dependent peptidase